MPDYHGPYFEDAVRRLALPGLGPSVMYFSLTGSCPCACEYCFASAGVDGADFGDEAALKVARSVAQLEIPLVNISGGEPLTRYPRLLKVIRALAVGSEVRMFTTGIGITPKRVQELQEAGLKGIFVSLDSCNPAAFDLQRGRPGAFKAAVKALRLFADSGMLSVVNCVVGKRSFSTTREVAHFLRFVEGIDPNVVVNFLPQMATGRGAQADSFRHPHECEEAAERIVRTSRDLSRPISMLFGKVDTLLGCPGAGGKLINVDIEGNVTVCISQASMGNILEEPFERIHARYVEACAQLKVGFFCCQASQATQGEVTKNAGSETLLESYFATNEDSDWQKVLRHFEGALSRLAVK
jgi:MoaA/NifB/PqqE/SkfB family radical SAM enzyme